MLNFHKQVGNVVKHILEQYEELFGTRLKLPNDCNREQMMAQLMGALNVSGRYFAFKEQIKVWITPYVTILLSKHRCVSQVCCRLHVLCSDWLCVCACCVQPTVVRFVRDKMQQTDTFTEQQDLHEFVSKLYVDLVDEMHVALNKVHAKNTFPTTWTHQGYNSLES